MHDLLIAIAFLSIVLAPCAAALWNRTEPAFPKARPFRPGLIVPGDPIRGESGAHRIDVLRCARGERFKMLQRHEVSMLTRQAVVSSSTARH